MKSLLQSLVLAALRAYKLIISPFLGQNCRFYPSCSVYADIAIRRHGVLRGSVLTGKRLCKCHPWHAGGVDLVPEITLKTDEACDVDVHSGLKLARLETGPVDHISAARQHPSNQPHFTPK